MNKQIPSINKLVQFHTFKRSMQLHQDKIKNAKPTLTTRIPNHLKINIALNKTAKQPFGNSFSRMIQIEFENKALLKKLTQKTGKPATSPQNHQQSWQQQSYMKQITNNRKKYFEQHERRMQNQGLLKRLKSVKPLYEMRKYMSERKTTEKYINSISKFNYKNYKPNKTIIKFDMDAVRYKDEMIGNSREKRVRDENEFEDKKNIDGRFQYNSEDEDGNNKESRLKESKGLENKLKKTKTKKMRVFTQRNPNINHHIKRTQHKPPKKHSLTKTHLKPSIDMKESNSSFYKASQKSFQLSQSQTKMMQSSFVITQIPEKQIKVNGKFYMLKGKQTMTKLRLEILEVKKDKTIGNEYIHEVEISSTVYKKKFGGRIDVIVERLKFCQKNQAFYIE